MRAHAAAPVAGGFPHVRELLPTLVRFVQGIRGLARNFKICDRDGSNKLDVGELAKCCSMCKLGLTPPEVEQLHKFFDQDNDGLVSYDEFIRTIRGRMSPVRRKLVTKVFNALDSAGDQNGKRRPWSNPGRTHDCVAPQGCTLASHNDAARVHRNPRAHGCTAPRGRTAAPQPKGASH